MSRKTSLFGLAMTAGLAVAVTATAALAQDAGRRLTVTMTGAAEAPNAGDPDGSGTATFTINAGQNEICYTLTVAGIDPATAAHIHKAPAGSPGPVVVPLEAPSDGSSEACVTVARDVIVAILADRAGYYVNVHNAEYPGGALRGQLGK
jgi:hypothetical protein